ncbi:MAG TPA: oligosaccharide flippase family protein [Acetobacteraceae bacterium]|nr:oligosaccharide flippase family protein [Acetobacteraceae bacterium]
MTIGPPEARTTDPERTGALLEKTAGGAGWTIGWRAATRALGFLSTLVLARILVPADFGLVALAMSFSRAIDIFADLGVQDALVRASHSSRASYDTAFTVNAIRGCITAVVIGVSAWPFARFFGDPRLFYVVLALGLAVLLDALENVGVADFRRDLAFHREFQLSIFPRIAQVIVTIALAFTWANYWALVAGTLTGRVLGTIASYVMHPYRPRLSLAARREIVGFSVWTWLVSMATMVRGRGVIMIIGGMLNPTQLGIFTVGSEIATLPETELIGPLSRASFSGFAAARRSGLSVAETYMRINSSMLVIAVPASIGISSIAAPLVYLAFGAKWLEATPIIEILAISGVFAVMDRISSSLFYAFAYLRPLFWNVVAMSAIQFALLVPFVWHSGIVGAAIASALAMLIQQTVLSILTFRRFAMRPMDLLSRVWRCLLAAAAMSAFLALSGLGWAGGAPSVSASLRQLFVTSGTGAGVYTGVLLSLWLASGRPNGPETDVLEVIRRVAIGLHGFASRRAALLWSAGSR